MVTVEFPQVVWTVEFGGEDPVVAEVTMTSAAGSGGGVTVHNDLDGRSTADAHPISAVSGLQAALDAAGGAGLSDAVPQPLSALADAGVAVVAARGDHVHPLPTAGEVGAVTAAGVDAQIAGAHLDGGQIQSGFVPDSHIPGSIARDSEVAAAQAAHVVAVDPHGDRAHADMVAAAAQAAAVAVSQPVDSDLTAIAALSTTVFGRSLLEQIDASALRTVAGAAPVSRSIAAGSGLTGGGTLAADRTLAVDFGAGAGKVVQGNDARLSDARTPTGHVHAAGDVTSGVLPIARIATGTPDGTKFVRDDGVLAVPPGGGGGAPTGPAGGDLTGTFPNPSIGSGKVTAAHITNGAIPVAKLAVDPLSRANHTGTQDASTIGSGIIASTRLGFGVADATKFLRGDNTWAPQGGMEWTVLARVTLSSTDVWPTFTGVPGTWPRYRLRWFSPSNTAAANGGLVRNMLLVFDDDVTAGAYFNAASSASAISVATLPQGGGAVGSMEVTRTAVMSASSTLKYGVTVRSDAAVNVPSGQASRVASAHSYLGPGPGMPPLAKWTITPSAVGVWTTFSFILEGADLP